MSVKHRNKYADKNGVCWRCDKKQESRFKPCYKCGGLVTSQQYKEESEEQKMRSFWFHVK